MRNCGETDTEASGNFSRDWHRTAALRIGIRDLHRQCPARCRWSRSEALTLLILKVSGTGFVLDKVAA